MQMICHGKMHFDLIISINTLHCLYSYDLEKALKEIERVGKNKKNIYVESYRNEAEKANLLYWQVTCEALIQLKNGFGGLTYVIIVVTTLSSF